jgi:hypothetical protein
MVTGHEIAALITPGNAERPAYGAQHPCRPVQAQPADCRPLAIEQQMLRKAGRS